MLEDIARTTIGISKPEPPENLHGLQRLGRRAIGVVEPWITTRDPQADQNSPDKRAISCFTAPPALNVSAY